MAVALPIAKVVERARFAGSCRVWPAGARPSPHIGGLLCRGVWENKTVRMHVNVVRFVVKRCWAGAAIVRVVAREQHAGVFEVVGVGGGHVPRALQRVETSRSRAFRCFGVDNQVVPELPVHAIKRFDPAVDQHVVSDVHLRGLIIKVNVD